MGDSCADIFEDRLGASEIRIGAACHNGQRTESRTLAASGYRGVDKADALLGKARGDRLCDLWADGAGVAAADARTTPRRSKSFTIPTKSRSARF